MAGADVRLGIVQVELTELHDLLEERGVLLGVEQRRGVAVVEAVLVAHVRRGMGGGNIAICFGRGPAVTSECCHVAPLVRLSVGGAGVQRGMARVRGRGEGALVHVGRGVRARAALVHAGQQVRRGRGMRLGGGHLAHQVRGVDGVVLRVQQLRVERVAEEGRVNGAAGVNAVAAAVVAAVREQAEVEVAGAVVVVGALWPKVRTRGALVDERLLLGLQEALVEGGGLRKGRRLRGGEVG